MRIQHNIMAMNAYRNYNTNTSALSKNLEKLSSGYKINRAGDDAAGLAISEKMRAQITGLNAAQKNVKDGISLVKTAEGAMQEIQDMLNRMDYLATQSANGTYDNEVDRYNLQKEVNQLKSEINRIADSANFNGIKLLDGSQAASVNELSDVSMTHLADAAHGTTAQKGIYTIDLKNYSAVPATNATGVTSIRIGTGNVVIAKATSTNKGDAVTGADFKAAAATVSIGGTTFKVDVKDSVITLEMEKTPTTDFNTDMKVNVAGVTLIDDTNGTLGNHAASLSVVVQQHAVKEAARTYAQGSFNIDNADMKDGFQLKIGNETYTLALGANSKFKNAANVVDMTDKEATDTSLGREFARRLSEAAQGNKMFKVSAQNSNNTIHLTEKEGANIDYTKNNLVGTTEDSYLDAKKEAWSGLVQKGSAAAGGVGGLQLQIGDTADAFNQLNVSVGDMHTKAMGIASLDISNQEGAAAAIDVIRNAINYVSGIRGDLGATQNRLEHTANNLSVMAENIQDAESTIRDTDVAEEMMAYTKNNILVQSAQAMLAQANAVPQGVLQLLG